MIKFLTSLVISGIAVAIAAYLTPGVNIDGLFSAILVAIVLGLVNATIGAILRFITFPVNFITFGLISSIICFFMILLTDNFVDGFHISNWFSGLVFALLLGIINSLFGKKKK